MQIAQAGEDIQFNSSTKISELIDSLKVGWVKRNTAILIIHGIGHQFPLETIDQFARGLYEEYQSHFKEDILIEHFVETKFQHNDVWFDNVLRLKSKNSPYYIDIYEYYWARYTEDKASWREISKWLDGVVNGAKNFYKDNMQIGLKYKDSSPFFSNKKFNGFKYRFFVSTVSKLIVVSSAVLGFFTRMLSLIPIVGASLSSWLEGFNKKIIGKIANVVGDIAIYNVVDPKSSLYEVRTKILNESVNSLKYLIQKKDVNDDLLYKSVIVAGHSLGSQIAYDSINRINLLINQNQINEYDSKGRYKNNPDFKISDQLNGFITFGSPLDKIAFFLRENIPQEEYLRQNILSAYHCFKQRDLVIDKKQIFHPCIERLLDDIKWINYHDAKDDVSGSLDYYLNVVNIDCQFNHFNKLNNRSEKWFTHSDYWKSSEFYRHVIHSCLS